MASEQIYNAGMKCTAGGSLKIQDAKNSPFAHHHKTLSGYIFTIKACINNQKKKLVNKQYILHMSSQHGELRPTYGWDQLASFGHPSKFQQVSHLGFITAWTNRRVTNWFCICICMCIFVRSLAGTWAGTLYYGRPM